MYALAILRYRRPLDEIQACTERHRAYLRDLKERGWLLASGPFDPRSGGAFLLRVPDAAALDRVRDEDPFWREGLASYELEVWAPVIGKEDLDRL